MLPPQVGPVSGLLTLGGVHCRASSHMPYRMQAVYSGRRSIPLGNECPTEVRAQEQFEW